MTATAQQSAAGVRPAPAGIRWRAVASGATWTIVLAAFVLAVVVFLVPRLMGGQALTVLSDSMEPTYSAGDVVVVVPAERYRIGDVVAFQPVSGDPTLITHRIVGMGSANGETSFRTQGDANGAVDDPIVAEQIMGAVAYSLPAVGRLALAAGEHRALLLTVLGAGLIGFGILSFVRGATHRTEPST